MPLQFFCPAKVQHVSSPTPSHKVLRKHMHFIYVKENKKRKKRADWTPTTRSTNFTQTSICKGIRKMQLLVMLWESAGLEIYSLKIFMYETLSVMGLYQYWIVLGSLGRSPHTGALRDVV